MDEVFGLKLFEKEEVEIPSIIQEKVNKIKIARKNKEWIEADKLKKEVKEMGYQVIDIPGDSYASYAIVINPYR
jgi:cysteinyl-tRNA synthetase